MVETSNLGDMPVSSNPKFKYQPIDTSAQEIRLLQISRTDASSRIGCTIQTIKLNTKPTYKALSYAWGTQLFTRPIVIAGQCFDVSDNLYWFLDQIQEDHHTLFWIDQICIDQNNPDEKSRQVSFMGEIYEKAVEVIVWLGRESDGSKEAMRWIATRRIPRILMEDSDIDEHGDLSNTKHTQWWTKTKRALSPSYYSDKMTPPALPKRLSGPNHDPNKMIVSPLRDLFSRPYWSRLWVIQEIFRGNEVVVWCGDMKVPWSRLEVFFKIPSKLDAEDLDDENAYENDADIDPYGVRPIVLEREDWKDSWEMNPPRLSYILTTFSHLECKDIRDKVFALLGLTRSYDQVSVDYTKPREEIYWAVLGNVVHDEHFMSMESHCEFGKRLRDILKVGNVDYLNIEAFVRVRINSGKRQQ